MYTLSRCAPLLPVLHWHRHRLAATDLFPQLELSVTEALQPELVPPGCWVCVVPQHKCCHHKRQALLARHCPGHIQGRVLVPPQRCPHPVQDVLAIPGPTLQIALHKSMLTGVHLANDQGRQTSRGHCAMHIVEMRVRRSALVGINPSFGGCLAEVGMNQACTDV